MESRPSCGRHLLALGSGQIQGTGELTTVQEQSVLDLAVRLANLADEYPRHIAIDAIDIAGVLLRSGRDYNLKAINLPSAPTQSLPSSQESFAAV
jgi:hypothetical protein